MSMVKEFKEFALKGNMVDLAIGDHPAHQFQRLGSYRKTDGCQSSHETCRAQHAHRILDEGRRHVALYARF